MTKQVVGTRFAPFSPSCARAEAVVMRVRKQGLKGLEASTIGLTLVGYIAAGFFIGQWLDGHFKTAFWMPLLVLVGTAAGFRDIIKLVTRMGANAKSESGDRAVMQRPMFSQTEDSGAAKSATAEASNLEEIDERPKPRIFSVPPPPKSSFDPTRQDEKAARSTPGLFAADDITQDDEETLIKKLLAATESDEESEAEIETENKKPQ